MAGEGDGGGPARVARTGIALVHKGEIVLPAAGSEAQAETVMDDARTTVTYHFPVEIEVRAGGQAIDVERIADIALTRLARSVRSRKV